jgi:hypothetical protein
MIAGCGGADCPAEKSRFSPYVKIKDGRPTEGTSEMKNYLLAGVLIIGFAGSAFAAAEISPSSPAKHFAVKDTVGVCSVIDVAPSHASDLKILGNKAGYASEKEAASALDSGCKDKIERG